MKSNTPYMKEIVNILADKESCAKIITVLKGASVGPTMCIVPLSVTVSHPQFGAATLSPLGPNFGVGLPLRLQKKFATLKHKHQLIKKYESRIPRKLKKKLKR